MRLFVAIPLPEEVRDTLVPLCAGLPGARWVPPENLHLTLRFVGEVSPPAMRDIDDELSRIEMDAFPLTLADVGTFGERRAQGTLWAGVEPSAPLLQLQGQTERALRNAGVAPETRKFHPHVTLARLKTTPKPKIGRYISEHSLFSSGPFIASEFVLFSSLLSQAGAIHREEQSYPLLGHDPEEPWDEDLTNPWENIRD